MILEQVFGRTLSQSDIELFQSCLKDTQRELRKILKTGSCSFVFMSELAACFARRDWYDPRSICDALRSLEDDDSVSVTKEAAPFTRQPLKGLWHKHFFQPSFMARNLMIETCRPAAMDVIWARFCGRDGYDAAGELAHAMTIEMYEKRAGEQRLTGEWIVFERDGETNCYLTLAEHDEGDEAIKARIDLGRVIDEKLRARACPNAHFR